MYEQGTVNCPCGRKTYCGDGDGCRHVGFCARRAKAERLDAVVKQQQKKRQAKPKTKMQLVPADVRYLYDGSFSGMLCCVHEAVCAREMPADIVAHGNAQPTLFEQKNIETDEDIAARVRTSIPAKISREAAELVEEVFLSCLAEKELATLRFLALGYEEGAQVTQMQGHPHVAPLLDASKKLGGEAHHLTGFIRFSDYDGVLVSTITPKNFVLPFIMGHFVGRFSQEKFLIYDKTHKAALIYQEGTPQIVPLEGLETPPPSEAEKQYRVMWKQFYQTIAIEARYNPKCRMTHMPKRFWQNMTEMSELL